MELGKLTVEYRNDKGKTAAKRMRSSGKIPAVCYGQGEPPMPLSLDPHHLVKALDPVKKTNTVILMTVSGNPNGKNELNVMVRDYQEDSITGKVIHADFIRVKLDADVRAIVPVILTGKAEGVKNGGILHQVIRQLEISCRPDKIPAKVEVDVTTLQLGYALHVRDLPLPEGVRPLIDEGTSVCSVTAPKAEKVEAAAEATPAEGAAAAPAAGDAAKGGAAAPAAGGKAAPAGKEAAGGDKKK